jgi:RyR domain
MTDEDIARVCHEANRALQIAQGEPVVSVHWDEKSDWRQELSVSGVRRYRAGETPEQVHAAWVERLTAEGWTLGDGKDPLAKTHPCLLPWRELPPEQQVKDLLFAAIVRVLAG